MTNPKYPDFEAALLDIQRDEGIVFSARRVLQVLSYKFAIGPDSSRYAYGEQNGRQDQTKSVVSRDIKPQT